MLMTFDKVRYFPKLHPIYLQLRPKHKLTPAEKEEKESPKVASDVIKYLTSTAEYNDFKDILPRSLLKKYKTPESMYLINRQTAKFIANTVKDHLRKNSPLIEVNPGLGLLTEQLLQCQDKHLYLYEASNYFSQQLNILQSKHPGRTTLKIADFFKMWKLAFQDKMDNGNRIKELLGELATTDKNRIVQIIGSMPGLTFIKHIIYNIVFHNTSEHLGRPDLYITMPGYHYEFLTDKEVNLSKHKSVPALFQLMFNSKVLKGVPKVHFLPWIHEPNNKRANMMDTCNLYLVNITQKEQLPCPTEYLPLLWYFFKPFVFSKSTKVIPMLEQWIPGCGVWLITGQDPPDTNRRLAPTEKDEPLPHMTIFTEFGDLTLQQKLTVFKKFISWPEFEQCQFRITMENNLPRSVTAHEKGDKDTIGSFADEDIDDHSDVESEELDKQK